MLTSKNLEHFKSVVQRVRQEKDMHTRTAIDNPILDDLICLAEDYLVKNPSTEPIPPRPWTHPLNFVVNDANGSSVLNMALVWPERSAAEASAILDFICDRVNAGENNPWVEIKAEYEKTFAQAHAILDSMGVPKANRVECNRPDCNSLLVHRLHELQGVYKRNQHTKVNQPDSSYISVRDVINRLCQICSVVMEDQYQCKIAADCFCGQKTVDINFRFSTAILDFIERAVAEKIERLKANASLP